MKLIQLVMIVSLVLIGSVCIDVQQVVADGVQQADTGYISLGTGTKGPKRLAVEVGGITDDGWLLAVGLDSWIRNAKFPKGMYYRPCPHPCHMPAGKLKTFEVNPYIKLGVAIPDVPRLVYAFVVGGVSIQSHRARVRSLCTGWYYQQEHDYKVKPLYGVGLQYQSVSRKYGAQIEYDNIRGTTIAIILRWE